MDDFEILESQSSEGYFDCILRLVDSKYQFQQELNLGSISPLAFLDVAIDVAKLLQ